MGDVGSGYLGFCFGALAAMTFSASAMSIWVWLILLGTFVVDASITLIRRFARREAIHRAHRSHAYQYASRRLGSHLTVTLAVGIINVFWLFPVAFVVTMGRLDGALGLLIAYTPLMWMALHYKAGEAQDC
jgi:Fuc2NAc and GlcNAc transferase